MKSRSAITRGVSILAGGLAFVGTADATELIIDGSFENTEASSNPVVRVGGKANPGVGGGWSTFSTYLYSTLYTLLGAINSGVQFLRPYPSGMYGITQSSQVVTQTVSLTATTTLTPAKIDSGLGRYSMAAWFSSYLTQGDFSDLTLDFLDENGNIIESISLGGQDFVANIPTGQNAKYANAKEWAKDLREGTIPRGARTARVTIGSTSSNGAPDGYVDLVSLDVLDAGVATPTVTSAAPDNNAVNVGPVVTIGVTLSDRSTSVDTNSIQLRLDNSLVTPTSIEKVETNTLVRFAAGLLPAKSAHTYSISFSDNGNPPANQTNQYKFTVADYLTLSSALRSPLGSEDATKPGFNVMVYQVDSIPSDDTITAAQKNIPGSISFSEAMLAGNAGTNVATLTGAEQGNTFAVPATIDWITSGGATANFPGDQPFPGIPGTSGSETSFVDDIRTFVRFPTAGYYQMGINNEDQFRLTAGTNLHQVLLITQPTNTPPIPAVALGTNVTQVQFGGALPLTPLTAEVLYATPSGDPTEACNITGTALQGKIALLDRGGTDPCNDPDKAAKAQAAGAVAVIMITPGDAGFPFRLGDVSSAVKIPVLVIAEQFGGAALKATLKAGTKVTAQISGDPAQRLVEWDGPKGFGAVDVTFGFAVTEPGIYPLRLIAGQGDGNANLEWFTIQPDGTRILVNDVSNTSALRTFRARTQAAQTAQLSVAKANGGITISWTGSGTLEETTTLSTNWASSASQANPQTIATTGNAKYFRIRQ